MFDRSKFHLSIL